MQRTKFDAKHAKGSYSKVAFLSWADASLTITVTKCRRFWEQNVLLQVRDLYTRWLAFQKILLSVRIYCQIPLGLKLKVKLMIQYFKSRPSRNVEKEIDLYRLCNFQNPNTNSSVSVYQQQNQNGQANHDGPHNEATLCSTSKIWPAYKWNREKIK